MANPVVPDWGSEDEGSSGFATSDDEQAYEVDRILAERKVDGADQYLVKWKNFGAEDCTWEPAESFDSPLTISLWEQARKQGDTLDASELQNVERMMACRRADNEKEEAARREHSKRQSKNIQIPKISPVGQGTTERKSTIKEVTSAKKGATTSLPSISLKRKASPSNPAIPQAEPAKQNQIFHGLSDNHQTARRTTGAQMTTASESRVGKPFRNLSHQNNAQKLRKQEPAPNISQLGTLRPVTELVPVHDVALNLPSGLRPLYLARNPTQEKFVESTDGEVERVLQPATVIVSPERPITGSVGQERTWYEPQLHQQISHAVFHSAPQRNQDMRFIRYEKEYFYHKWGEVVVQMSVGTRLIGHVKLIGLLRPGDSSSPLIASLLRTREGSILGMRFEQEDADDLQEYNLFEHEASARGSIEPYDNAKDEFYRLLAFFNTHSKVACVWRHDSVAWIMIAYSSRAALFVEKGFPTVSGGLAFIVCRRTPWRNTSVATAQPQLSSRIDDSHPSLSNALVDSGSNTPMEIDSSPMVVLSAKASSISQSTTGLESANSEAEVSERMSILHPRQGKPPDETPIVKILANTNRDELTFEQKYGISYQSLTRIPPTVRPLLEKGKFDRHVVRFFLAFKEEKNNEEVELKRWLITRTPAYMIYSSSEEHAWDRYKDAMRAADHVGIILIHEDFVLTAFSFMNGLAKRIRREDIQIFRVSLEHPSYDLSSHNFEKLFPSGLVVLITERTIFDNAKDTAALFDWFVKKSKAKKNWRLFLRPQPQQYLRDLCELDLPEEDRSSHERSLMLLEMLQPLAGAISPTPASPDENEESSSYVLTPLSLPMFSEGDEDTSLVTRNTKKITERDAKLLNFYCGWAFNQISNFRRFVAITPHISEDTRNRNCHVDFLTLPEFEAGHLGKQSEPKLLTPRDSPMSPVVRSAVLKET